METTFQIGGVKVKVIDLSSHEQRAERLQKPLKEYFKNIKEKDNETKNRKP